MPRNKKKTAAEKLGYRWMMRLLRALDKGRNQVIVHHADSRGFPGGFMAFKAACSPAVKEAVSLMRHGSMALYHSFEKPKARNPGKPPGHFPRSYKVVFFLM